MASHNLAFTLGQTSSLPDVKPGLAKAIKQSAAAMLQPPIQNLGCPGILKMSREVLTWFKRSQNPIRDFSLCSALMERGGTGGGLFRNLYAAFLQEAGELTLNPAYLRAAAEYKVIAGQWTQASQLIKTAGKTGSEKYLSELSNLLKDISENERMSLARLL
jgi:hypothetical protein